jgi:hypothetical protein
MNPVLIYISYWGIVLGASAVLSTAWWAIMQPFEWENDD